jgi:diguanylate cyclase (GGDEF)-like protein
MINGHKIIALCISRLHDMDNFRFISSLSRQLAEHNCNLFIYDITADLYWDEDDLRAEAAVFNLINYDITDAVIIMDEKIKSKTITEKIIANCQVSGTPAIVVDGRYDNCTKINFDYGTGFEKIVRHVIEDHKVRSAMLIAGIKGNPFSEERENIFRKVLTENNIPFTEDMIMYGEFWAKPAIACAEYIIRSGKVPRAVICANDIMAINVSTVFTEHGYRVPEDVIITGFDGIDEINYSFPKISSMRCSSLEMADAAYKAVMYCLNGSDTQEEFFVEPSMRLNESCGCAHAAKEDNTIKTQLFNDRFYRYQDDTRVLSDVTDRMTASDDITQAAYHLFVSVIHDMCCIIDKKFLDHTSDSSDIPTDYKFDDEMFMFFDTDSTPFQQYNVSRKLIFPGIENYLDGCSPIIFNIVDYMNSPIGYICFHFPDCDLTDYCMIPQILSAIGRGLGGFNAMQYQRHLLEKLEEVYKYDSLTTLYTRTSFSKEYEKLRRDISERHIQMTVVLADLDGLKQINDRFGHAAGDNAIKNVALALKRACPPDALCVRFGGDEMLAVIVGGCDTEGIRKNIKQTLDNYNTRSRSAYRVSASIGIYCTDSQSDTDFETIVKKSDAMMYAEKQAKKAADAARYGISR